MQASALRPDPPVKLPDLAAAAEHLLSTRLPLLVTVIALIGFAALAVGAEADASAARSPVYGLSSQRLPSEPEMPVAPPHPIQPAQASLRGMQPGS